MKKLFTLIAFVLALNFVALAGGVGYLYQSKRLDKDKVNAIKELLFPPEVAATQPTTAPSEDATTQPSMSLDQFLKEHAGMPAADQVALLQRTFDSRLATLDRQQREVKSLQDLVNNAERQLKTERDAFEKEKTAFEKREREAAALATDAGFQKSLELYGTMKPKQVKDIFTGLSDEVVVRFLREMQPRQVTKILAEFKTPAELDRVKMLMEQVRAAESSAASAKQ